MKDYVVRATAAKGSVMIFSAITTNMVEKARKTHNLSPDSTVALGKALTATAMMSAMLKNKKDRITIQIRGDGRLGGIVTVGQGELKIKGYVYNTKAEVPLKEGKINTADLVGKEGYINVIKDMGLKEPYIGFVELFSGEVAEDLTYYFAHSEQIPTVVSLGVLVDRDGSVINSGGYIIQLMPDAEESISNYIENTVSSIPGITELFSYGETPETILDLIFGEKELKISTIKECEYVCDCSREKMERNLMSLGIKELREIIDEQHSAEVCCHFCNSKYRFDEEQLLKLIDEISS